MHPVSRFVAPLAVLAAIGLFAIAFNTDPNLYTSVLKHWMRLPYERPFMDWEAMPAAIECWGRGVDVYVDLPCYRPGKSVVHNYSPLWLRFTFLPTDPASVQMQGLLIIMAFAVALLGLPAPRRPRDLVILLLAVFSGACVFGLERANVDVLVFILTVVAVRLWSGRLGSRGLGYALMMLTGLLKFYPLTVLLLVLRERIKSFIVLSVLAAMVLLAFAWGFHDELSKALAHIPHGGSFGDFIGATNLPTGSIKLLVRALESSGLHNAFVLNSIKTAGPPALKILLLLASLGLGLWLCFRGGVRESMQRLSPACRGLLVAGAMLVIGCFFVGQNISYRSMLLILALPGLSALSTETPTRLGRVTISIAYFAVPFVLWRMGIQGLISDLAPDGPKLSDETAIGIVHWLADESLWWWIVSVLGSAVIGFVSTSNTAEALFAGLRRRRLPTQAAH